MTILLADGYEVGATLAEANLMSGNVITKSAFVNATSIIDFSASTLGSGRSLKLSVFGSGTPSTNRPTLGVLPPNIMLASGAVGYQLSIGFFGLLSTTFTGSAAMGLRAADSASATSVFALAKTGANTNGSSYSVFLGTTSRGTFTIADVSIPHYYTFNIIKTAANVWTLNVWVDSIQVLSVPNIAVSLPDNPFFNYVFADGAVATAQVSIFSEFDDLYISDTAPLGKISIRRISPNADVQAQWVKVGNQTTNYQSIDNVSLSTGNLVTSDVPATDIYGNGSQITNGKKVLAIRGSAICTGSPSDTITETITVSGTPITSAPTALSGADMLVTTGWQTTTLPNALSNVRFGMTKN